MHIFLCVTACNVVTKVATTLAPPQELLYWRLVRVLQPQQRACEQGQKKVVHSICGLFRSNPEIFRASDFCHISVTYQAC